MPLLFALVDCAAWARIPRRRELADEPNVADEPTAADEPEQLEVDLMSRDDVEIPGVSAQPGSPSAQERRDEA